MATYLVSGDLVPDNLILDAVQTEIDRLQARDRGWIVDGFPRTIRQADYLATVAGQTITAAIGLTASLDVLLSRLTRRRICPGCGASCAAPAGYIDAIACINGDGIAIRRPDDNPTTIAHRLAIYDRHTQPLIGWFRDKCPLITVDHDGTPAETHSLILEALESVLDVGSYPPRRRTVPTERVRTDRASAANRLRVIDGARSTRAGAPGEQEIELTAADDGIRSPGESRRHADERGPPSTYEGNDTMAPHRADEADDRWHYYHVSTP